MEDFRKTFRGPSWLALALVIGGCLFASPLHAASLFFSPSSGVHEVGEYFSVNFLVGSADAAMNAVQTQVHVSEGILGIVSVTKTRSAMSLWVQEPTLNKPAGLIDLAAVVLNPGYTGPGANIITMTLVGKATGVGMVGVVSGQVLANDGVGTDLLKSRGSGTYTIVPASPKPVAPPPVVQKPVEAPVVVVPPPPRRYVTPGAAELFSPTHPMPDEWYAKADVGFEWKVPSDANGLNYVFDHSPATIPGEKSLGVKTAMSYQRVEDGTWYFHLRLRNSDGWGATAHRKVSIDTTVPKRVEILRTACGLLASDHTNFVFDAYDELSGIAGYAVSIDSGDEMPWVDNGNHVYVVPLLPQGKHTLTVRAIDGAGNSKTSSTELAIGTLLDPVIISYTKIVPYASSFAVSGYTSPNAAVRLRIFTNQKEITRIVQADRVGSFAFSEAQLMRGDYTFLVEASDSPTGNRAASGRLAFQVLLKPVFEQFVIQYPVDVAIFLLVVLIFLLIYLFRVKLHSVAITKPAHKKKPIRHASAQE